jgi:hypothetical protein
LAISSKSQYLRIVKDLPPIQAADLLAYETRKELENRIEARPVSKALDRLVNGRIHFARCAVFPELPEFLRLKSAGIVPDATASVLFHSDKPIRGKGNWGVS